MLYALTIQAGEDWSSVDTLIVEDKNDLLSKLSKKRDWLAYDRLIVKILRLAGYSEEQAIGVVEERVFFLVNADDIIVSLTDTYEDKKLQKISKKEDELISKLSRSGYGKLLKKLSEE